MKRTEIDTSAFEQVCYLILQRVKRLKQVPFMDLCHAISDLASEHSSDSETEYLFCLPEPYGYGHLAYPHEVFLQPIPATETSPAYESRLLTVAFWKGIIRKFRQTKITDPTIIDFADKVALRLKIAS